MKFHLKLIRFTKLKIIIEFAEWMDCAQCFCAIQMKCLMNERQAIINIKVTNELLLLFGTAWKSYILKYNVKILKRNENEENKKAVIMVGANTRLSTNKEQRTMRMKKFVHKQSENCYLLIFAVISSTFLVHFS